MKRFLFLLITVMLIATMVGCSTNENIKDLISTNSSISQSGVSNSSNGKLSSISQENSSSSLKEDSNSENSQESTQTSLGSSQGEQQNSNSQSTTNSVESSDSISSESSESEEDIDDGIVRYGYSYDVVEYEQDNKIVEVIILVDGQQVSRVKEGQEFVIVLKELRPFNNPIDDAYISFINTEDDTVIMGPDQISVYFESNSYISTPIICTGEIFIEIYVGFQTDFV